MSQEIKKLFTHRRKYSGKILKYLEFLITSEEIETVWKKKYLHEKNECLEK